MQYTVHLFGASTSIGYALLEHLPGNLPVSRIFSYSRTNPSCFADLSQPDSFVFSGDPSQPAIIVCLAPLVLFSSFIDQITSSRPAFLSHVRAIFACSSSSALTKRYAFSDYDRNLSSALTLSENLLLDICAKYRISCQIFQPTLVYGRVGPYRDRNVSRLIGIVQRLPILLVPSQSGLRQPIHASQLASVILFSINRFIQEPDHFTLSRLAIGGDTTLSYAEILLKLSSLNHAPVLRLRRCFLLPIPNSLFIFLATPLLFLSQKSYEAMVRMCSNLSGFQTSASYTGGVSREFPVEPY